MTNHVNKYKVTEISMPKAGCGLDRLEWYKFERLIKEICAQSNLTITVNEQSRDEQSQKQTETPVRSALGQAQRQDEALSKLIEWIEKGEEPTSQELQGLPRLAWQLNNHLKSLQLFDGILCGKFETADNQVVLQQIVPPSMTQKNLSACHSSPTAGHLGVAKTSEKIKQRVHWPGMQEDTKLFVSRCPECQKRSGPPKKYHHSLIEWQASYPFHHIGIDFMGPLPMSNGNKHILVIGDHFTKWYEAIPLPDQTAVTTANALVDHWISRFGCPHSLHIDQGRNFVSKLFEKLKQLLEMDKTGTTPFNLQSNAVIEKMNKTLQNMLAKCVNEEQSNWSQQLPYVMMAYRSSVHESTGYTPQFLVFRQELSLPLDCMYLKPQEIEITDVHEFVYNKQQAFQQAFELVRRTLNEKQKRRNAIYNKKVHGPTYKEGQKVLLYHPAIVVGTTSKFASPWKGPYVIEKCLNDVTFRIKEENSAKQQIVHYDRLKPFFEPPPTSNLPTRNKPRNFQPTQDRVDTHKHINGTLNHHDCLSFLPAPSSISTPKPTEGRTTASITPSRITPLIASVPTRREATRSSPVFSPSPTLEQPSPHPNIDVAIQSPATPQIEIQPLIRENDFPHEIQSPRDNVTEIVDAAARNLRRTPPANTSNKQLRPNTSSQRKAQPLFTTYLPDIVTNFFSPERKTQKQSGTKNKTPSGKRKTHHQK